MKLIIGLGNPGKEYDNTRHNIGFMVIDELFKQKQTNPLWQNKFNATYTSLNINAEKVYFLKPLTYMNLSGTAIQEFMHYFKIETKDILIIHDDLDLPLGKYRLKVNSSAGGHNGIKSIIECLGTNSFARLKVGIGKNSHYDTKDYVLSSFSKAEQEELSKLYPTLIKIIYSFLELNINELMNKYNGAK